MAYTIRTADQIVADMVAYIVTHSSVVTDMTPGSVIRSFCEAVGLGVEELYVGFYLAVQRELSNMKGSVFGLTRKTGVKAGVTLRFTRSGSSGITAIPAGTRVTTASGLRFTTDALVNITDGNTYADSPSHAEFVGKEYNVSGSTITVLEDVITGVTSVTNSAAATGGVDEESDVQFQQRAQAYVEGLGRSNVAGLKYAALSVEGVTNVSVVELIPPVANVNVDVYVDDGSSGGVSAATVTEVQDLIDGDGTETNPGYRAAGINVEVKKPTVTTQDVEVDLTLLSDADQDTTEAAVTVAITEYVNGLAIGDDILYNGIVAAVMSVYGVANCDVTTPAADVTIAGTNVGRVGTITLNV